MFMMSWLKVHPIGDPILGNGYGHDLLVGLTRIRVFAHLMMTVMWAHHD